jgi:hypothetical protein
MPRTTHPDRPFLAEAQAVVAAQRAKAAEHFTGVSWSGMSRPAPVVEDVETVRQRIAPLLTTQATIDAEDARRVVAVVVAGAVTLTNLSALCAAHGLDWSERSDIRAALAAGRPYRQADAAGWSGLPTNAVVSAQASVRRVA